VIYRFGGFELEPERRSLRSTESAQPVALTGKLFDVLVYLIEHRGHLIEKRELLEAVWPNVIVEEANLPQSISMLRRALGEDSRAHEYIATISGRGYQFVAAVDVVGPEPVGGAGAKDNSSASPEPARAGSIEEARSGLDGFGEPLAGSREPPSAAAARPAWQRALPVATGLAGASVAGVLVWTLMRPAALPPPPVSQYLVTPSATAPLSNLGGVDLAISPDGTRLAYFSPNAQSDRFTLYVRDFDELDARVVPGVEVTLTANEAAYPFFSADGEWIGFRAPGQGIMRVAVSGGPPLKMLDDRPTFLDAAWGADDTLIVSSGFGLVRASAGGGRTPELLTGATESGSAFYVAPVLLPGGRALLFTLQEGNADRVAILNLESREQRILIEDGQNAFYAATGHIVFARGTTLMAQPFDVDRLAVTGEPVTVLEGVRNPGANTAADYALSASGTLVYVPGGAAATATGALVWVDRTGRVTAQAVNESVDFPREPRLSPDGRRLVVTAGPFNDGDLWIYDLGGRPPILLVDEGDNRYATWSPDGAQVAFLSNRGGSYDLYIALTNGSVVDPLPLRAGGLSAPPVVWSAEGELILNRGAADGLGDIVATRVEPESKVLDVVATEDGEFNPALSPNGRWLAYATDRTGRPEVLVTRYPDGVPVRVSRDGGVEPRWSVDGRELLYLQGYAMMAVAVEADAEFSFDAAVQLFDEPSFYRDPSVSSHTYDLARDGRFLMIQRSASATATAGSSSIVVVENWLEELKQRVPTGQSQ
jgi:eukaryotic-like serine/threonine-protein kinase